ncbi:MAG: hypothetical protein CMJ18_08780 [Phycisphaeraceae bacterium]|nr:hypothetical protein [Phycisphaeraceae bacterium]
MISKSREELHALVKGTLMAAGADEPNAEDVAEHLVLASLSGVDSHGVWHLLGYVKAIRDGDIVPTAHGEVLRQTPSSALVTGHWSFGQPVTKIATEIAMDKAADTGIAIVGVVQKHHLGRLGHYVEMAAARGMGCMIYGGGQGEIAPATMPFGAARRAMHTNPMAAGLPTGTDDQPMMFDFATSWTSGVKVINARNRGEKLPHGYVVDQRGRPTDDPNDFFDDGGHAPFGGHKGYAVMMLVEFMGRVLLGTNAYADDARGGDILRNEGGTIIVFRADLFQDMAAYTGYADEMGERIRALAPAEGFDKVMMPGDPEAETRRTRRRDGIPIMDDVWKTIVEAAELAGYEGT